MLRIAASAAIAIVCVPGFARGRVPGWDYIFILGLFVASQFLDEASASAWVARLRGVAPGWLSRGLALLGLCLVLAGSQGKWDWRAVAGGVLVVPLVVRWFRGDRPSVAFALVAGFTVLYSVGIGYWRYSVIGDEYSFFIQARTIVREHGLLGMGSRLFTGLAVYGTHPYLSSVIHAVSMWLFGVDNFGWRFSNGFLMALSVGLLYRFWFGFLSPRAALTAAILQGTSYYLINFSKIGYNNVQALFAGAVVLWAAGRAARAPGRLTLTGLGLAMGLCLYVYPAALYVLPLPVILLLLYGPQQRRAALRNWGLILASFGLMAVPLLFQGKYWQSKIAGTFFNNPDIVATPASTLRHLAINSLYATVSYAYSPEESHFVVASYVDPLTALFIPIGAALAFRRARKDRFAAFLTLSVLLELVLVGVTHDRRLPPATRMFMLIPWWSVLAALGLLWVLERFDLRSDRRWPLAVILCLIGVLNLYQASGLLRLRYEGLASLEVLFLRLVQREARAGSVNSTLYLFLTQANWGIDGIRLLRDVYGVPASQDNLARMVVEAPSLAPDVADAITRSATVVILQPWMEQPLREALEAILRDLGKKECLVKEGPLTQRVVFSLWLSPGREDLCRLANMP